MIKLYRLLLLSISAVFCVFMLASEPVSAQALPFTFRLVPIHEDGKITYQIFLRKDVEWDMTDVTMKFPVPEGTRFVKAGAVSSFETTFDGQEVTFFASVFNRRLFLGDAYFVVEIVDPAMVTFTAQPWLSWKGEYPGDYLPNEVDFDITRRPFVWEPPFLPRLQLEATAESDDQIVTYYIHPKNNGGRRMWDAEIKVPIPEGATFLSAQPSFPFTSSFDGKEVTFFAIELEAGLEVSPLSFQVSIENVTTPLVTTHAWAVWKNSDRKVGTSIVFQEEMRTGDIVVQSERSDSVMSDVLGDVPFPYYDVTSVVFEEDAAALKVNFHLAESLELAEEPPLFGLFVDTDCSLDTGTIAHIKSYGMDHIIRYRHAQSEADIVDWDQETGKWLWNVEKIKLKSSVEDKQVTIWVPYDIFKDSQSFCWEGQAWVNMPEFEPGPPRDLILGSEIVRLTQYQFKEPIIGKHTGIYETNSDSEPLSTSVPIEDGYLIGSDDDWQYLKGYGEASYPVTEWQQLNYDDTGWFEGPVSIGYGNENVATVLEDMRDNYLSVFLRRSFTIPDPKTVQSLVLEIDYSDGFVAYLNGTEIARRNMGGPSNPIVYNTEAISNQGVDNREVINISDFNNLLRPGSNVLAIQGHNDREFSKSFSIKPALRWQYLSGSLNDDASALVLPASNENPLESVVASDDSIQACEVEPEPEVAATPDIVGKLAVPIDTGQVTYDLHVFSMPDGQEIIKIPNARQPNFRFDGQRMLINREGGGVENIYEYNFANGLEEKVSDAPQDWHPVYDPWGNRVAYGNFELTVGSREALRDSNGGIVHSAHDTDILYHAPKKPFIFVQCGLLPPHQETDPICKNIPISGVLVPAGHVGEIQGSHPVWTSNDMIAYKGCNSWVGGSLCGIFIVPSASTKGFSDGFIPRQLTRHTSDTPTDTKNVSIAFMSERDGNWEAYVMDLNGDGVQNLSNSPGSNDGIPTISPDGNWVAFVSDRDGRWAVWVTPITGGPAQKLFDLPSDKPWGDGDRSWVNERISWGP